MIKRNVLLRVVILGKFLMNVFPLGDGSEPAPPAGQTAAVGDVVFNKGQRC